MGELWVIQVPNVITPVQSCLFSAPAIQLEGASVYRALGVPNELVSLILLSQWLDVAPESQHNNGCEQGGWDD